MSQSFPRPVGEGGGEKPAVAGGGFGPYDPEMDARVSVLETHMEYVRADLAEIKAGQKTTAAAITTLVAAMERLTSKVESFDQRFEAIDLKVSKQLEAMDTKVSKQLEASELKLSGIVESSALKLSAQMAALPTKTDLKSYYLQSVAIGFAFLVLVVGGIVGGLDWIKVH